MQLKRWILSLAAGGSMMIGAAEIKSGDSIAFLGDSITQQGWGSSGYIRLCEAVFRANDLNIRVYPAGIGGHKSNQMLARLERDVIGKKPTFMTLSCGVNDVWHGVRGVPLEDYKKNVTSIVDQCQANGIRVILLTATMIGEDVTRAENQKLASYNAFLKELAGRKKCILVDLNSEMREIVAEKRRAAGKKDAQGSSFLTTDGVHMDYAGNRMMADGILRALGFTPAEVAKADGAVAALRYVPPRISWEGRFTVADYAKLAEKANAEKLSVSEYLSREMNARLKELLK